MHDQNIILQNDESRHIMHLVKDDTSSLLWLKDTDSYFGRQSIFSESSSMLDVNFDFDPKILNSKPYQAAIRSALVRKKGEMSQGQRTPPNDATSVVDHSRSDDTEDDARTVRSKTLDSKPLNDKNSNEIIKKSNHTDDATFFIRKKSGKIPQHQNPHSNEARNVVGYESSKGTEDNVQTVRSIKVNSWQLNRAIFNGIIKKSNQADDAPHVTPEKKGKMPQRQGPAFNDAMIMPVCERFNDSEDDAKTIRGVSVNPRSPDDATELISDKRSSHIEDDAQIGIVAKKLHVKYPNYSPIGLAASDIYGVRSNEDRQLTDTRWPEYINSATKTHILAKLKRALFKLSIPTLSLTTNEEGRNSLSMKDVNRNSQPSPSSVARRHHQKSFKVLILGASGAGKSTLLKSMTICHEGRLCSPNERERYIDIIHSSLIEDLRNILDAMITFEIPLDSDENLDHVVAIYTARGPYEFSEDSEGIALAIKALWDDSGVQTCVRMSNSCRLNDHSG